MAAYDAGAPDVGTLTSWSIKIDYTTPGGAGNPLTYTWFGEAFARSIQFDPLEGPGNQVNEAADEAIKRYPFIDGSRQAAGGASYGGHLANWLAVTTDRYKALVSHAGLYDLKSQWTTSDVAVPNSLSVSLFTSA